MARLSYEIPRRSRVEIDGFIQAAKILFPELSIPVYRAMTCGWPIDVDVTRQLHEADVVRGAMDLKWCRECSSWVLPSVAYKVPCPENLEGRISVRLCTQCGEQVFAQER